MHTHYSNGKYCFDLHYSFIPTYHTSKIIPHTLVKVKTFYQQLAAFYKNWNKALSTHKMQATATAFMSPIIPQRRTAATETFTGMVSIFLPHMVSIVALLQHAAFKCLNKPQLNPKTFLDHNWSGSASGRIET